jgi:hypothetical protein
MIATYLLCEGSKNSFDRQILDTIVADISGLEIHPMGGKFGSGAYLQGFLGAMSKMPSYLTFRDRDFDADVPVMPSLTISPYQKHVYMSYRATIENYLLTPTAVFDFCSDRNIDGFTNVNEVETVFRKSAEDIKYYQAARWALGAIREKVESRTSWTDKSGDLPENLSEVACISAAKTLLWGIQKQVGNWTPENFEAKYQYYLGKFDMTFFENEKYLIWFQAKDLQTQLSQYLPKHNGNDFPFKTFYKDAIKHFDYTQFPDLVELRNLIISLSTE